MIIELIGWVGAILFALCGLPQAWMAWKNKNSDGLAWGFLLMWFGGEVLTFTYVMTKSDVLPLLVNYTLNFVFLLIILWYKVFPKYPVES